MNELNRENTDMTNVVRSAKLKFARTEIKAAITAVKKLLKDGEPDDRLRNMMLDMGSMCDELESRSTRLREGCEGGICATSGGIIQ